MRKSIILSVLISQAAFFLLFPIFVHLFSYLHPIVLAVVWLCLTAFISFIVFYIRKEVVSVSYRIVLFILTLYTISLLILLFLRPSNQEYNSWNLIPFSTIVFYLSGKVAPFVAFYNLVANILLFVPYGLILMGKKQKGSIRLSYLFFLPIISISLLEIMQFATHRGSLDIDDLILNVLGFYFGYLLYPLFTRVVNIG